jgi:hypothetical protein
MKKLFLLFVLVLHLMYFAKAQSAEQKLPWAYYMTMTNSCNSADIVLLQGNGGSVNIDKTNMGFVRDIVSNVPAEKISAQPSATIMCLLDGKEFISGSIFMDGNNGVVSFNVEGKEYTNRLSEKGIEFFRSVISL